MSEKRNRFRIVIAEEQAAVRRHVFKLLAAEPDLEIVGEASDAHGAIQLARQVKPDVLLLDFAFSRAFKDLCLNGFAAYVSLVRVVVMVSSIQKNDIIEAFNVGAHGIVLKTSAPRVWLKSIRGVMAGHYWLEGESIAVLVEVLRELLPQANGFETPKDYGLTRRELEIITKIVSGRSNKEVGEEFSITERTVKHHLTNIFGKVGVSNRLQLALFAVNHHLTAHPVPSLALHALPQQEEG